eukprot:Skav209295  [mRNA]  locus=scaffold994:15616:25217:+ [translate_table: standard]
MSDMPLVAQLHTAGRFKDLPNYEPRMFFMKPGARVTLVASVTMLDDQGQGGHRCAGLVTGQSFRLQTRLKPSTSKVAIINGRLDHFRSPVVHVDEATIILEHGTRHAKDYLNVVEFCTGLGALGMGAEEAGFHVLAQNELQEAFANHQKQFASVVMVNGDVGNLQLAKDLHEAGSEAGTAAFGFSCQPFSQLGDRKEQNDDRARTLPNGLFMSYLLQKDVICLECVPQAATSPYVQLCIENHLASTKSTRSEQLLELSSLWPCRRRRWWSLITPGHFGQVLIPSLPKLPTVPTVNCLLPTMLPLSEQEHSELALTPHEVQMFETYGKGLNRQVVDTHKELPTSLHSWGNQCYDCSCGCRRAFSHKRLTDGGLHGALIAMQGDEQPEYRHLGPREMAILNAFPKESGWNDSQRLLMSGVGQLASPMQSAWVFAHLSNHLSQLQMIGHNPLPPNEILARLCDKLFMLRDRWAQDQTPVSVVMFQEAIQQLLRPVAALPLDEDASQTMPDESMEPTSVVLSDPTAQSEPPSLALPSHLGVPLPRETDSTESTEPVFTTTGGIRAFASTLRAVMSQAAQVATPRSEGHAEAPHNASNSTEGEEIPVDSASRHDGQSLAEAVHDTTSAQPASPADRATPAEATEPTRTEAPEEETHASQTEGLSRAVDATDGPGPLPPTMQVTLVDVIAEQWYPVKLSSATSLAQLKHAEQSLRQAEIKFMSLLGFELTEDHVFIPEEWILVMPVNHALPASLPEIVRVSRGQSRLTGLFAQQSSVAIDEMQYYLHQLNLSNHALALPTVLLESLEDVPAVEDRPLQVMTTVAGAGIWTLLYPHDVHRVEVIETEELPLLFKWDCGFQAFSWIVSQVTVTEVQSMSIVRATQWRQMFLQKIFHQGVWHLKQHHLHVGGHGSELEIAVAAILRTHGVFHDRAIERAQTILKQLGPSAVTNAIKSTRPWASLKSLANAQTPRLRLVQEDEFQQVVGDRAKAGTPVGTKQNRVRKTPTQGPPAILHPQEIMLPTGVFIQQDGQPLSQLQIRQLTPNAQGVVILTEPEFEPFATQKITSPAGLAFIILGSCSEEVQKMGTSVGFPAHVVATSAPTLLQGVLIQKGQQTVKRAMPTNPMKIEQVETQTLKLLLYRDQCEISWDEVCDKPIRQVLTMLPFLKTCKAVQCTCENWHPTDGDQVEPLLDVWQRDFVNLFFKRTKPKEALMFTCMIRVKSCEVPKVLEASGQSGLYVEARTHDGRAQDPRFHTVWLQKHSFEQARAAQASVTDQTCLMRVANRYGLRIQQDKAQAMHNQFKPDTPFLSGSALSTWVLGPLPWGTTRKALLSTFQSWEWPAKPLQPAGRSAQGDGLQWHVVAANPPPLFVYSMSHGDVLIRKLEPVAAATTDTTVPPSRGQPLQGDPWAPTAAKLQPPQISQVQLARIEEQVTNKVMKSMQKDHDEPMTQAYEPRIAALEAQLQQVQQEQQQLNQNHATMQTRVDQLGNQIEGHSRKILSHLDQKMQTQMDNIEALLAKRLKQHLAGWSSEQYQSSRLAAASFLVGTSWVTGGVAYGYAQSSNAELKQCTEELLQELTSKVVLPGHHYAFVAGDFNQEPGVLDTPRRWEACGWKEIQDIAYARWGLTPTTTCKHKTRKDYLYISPGLQSLLLSVSNEWETFADHSILRATFAMPSAPPKQAMWYTPDPVPCLTHADRLAIQAVGALPGRPEQEVGTKLEQVFSQYEELVHKHLQGQGKPGLNFRQRGRARTCHRTFTEPNQAPLKPSRPGEPMPTLEEHNLRYKRWFTQLRRLRSYMFLTRTGSTKDAVIEQKVREWGAVLRATGFGMSFQSWWVRHMQSAVVVHVPDEPPPHSIAQQLHDAFHVTVEAYAQQVKQRKQRQGPQSYWDNPNLVYRDLKTQRPPPVQVLVAKQTVTVTAVHDEMTLQVEPSPNVSDHTQWESTQGFHHITSQACHSASTVHLSQTTFLEMRRGATKALSVSKAGSNPTLHLALHPNALLDPEFFCLWDSVQKMRKFGRQEVVAMGIAEAAWTPPRLKKPGPCGVLVSRLERIGWRHHHDTTFVDQDDLLVDILNLPIQEVKYRLKRAWHQAIGSEHSYRKGFQGLHTVDVKLSHVFPSESTQEDVGLVMALHNGSFITHDQLHQAEVTSDSRCMFCQEEDSLDHRHWHCAATAHCRQHLSTNHLESIQAGPECLRHRGWMVEPPEVLQYKRTLNDIPDTTNLAGPVETAGDAPLDLFTDGTCRSPQEPVVRLAAWSVVQSIGMWDEARHQLISHGGVPGQWQTIQRAEITAVLSALRTGIRMQRAVRIWCDNALVVRRFQAMQRGSFQVHPSQADHDLWQLMHELLQQSHVDTTICKVYSHQTFGEDELDNWAFAGNAAADMAAADALLQLPAHVLVAQGKAEQAMRRAKDLALAVSRTIIAVGRFCIQQPKPELPERQEQGQSPITDTQIVHVNQWIRNVELLPRGLLFPGFHKIVEWLTRLTDDTAPARWVTWYELMWSFQIFTGSPGVERYGTNSTWKMMSHHRQYDLTKTCQALGAYLQAVFKFFVADFKSSHVKPSYYRWLSWGQCVALRWHADDMNRVHRWLDDQLGTKQIKTLSKDLSGLPPATMELDCKPTAGLHRYFH